MALEKIYSDEDIPMEVMGLYLDFINLLLNILELVREVIKDGD